MNSKVCFIFHRVHVLQQFIFGSSISIIVKANFSVIKAKSHFILDCAEQFHAVIVLSEPPLVGEGNYLEAKTDGR